MKRKREHEWAILLPYRAIDTLIELMIWLYRYPRRRRLAERRRRGLCYYCGYDVQGTEGRCPECGKYPIFRKTPLSDDWPEITD